MDTSKIQTSSDLLLQITGLDSDDPHFEEDILALALRARCVQIPDDSRNMIVQALEMHIPFIMGADASAAIDETLTTLTGPLLAARKGMR